MKLTKSQITKIIISLLFFIIFNFTFSVRSYASFSRGIMTKPICYLIVSSTDQANRLLASFLVPWQDTWEGFWDALDEGLKEIGFLTEKQKF